MALWAAVVEGSPWIGHSGAGAQAQSYWHSSSVDPFLCVVCPSRMGQTAMNMDRICNVQAYMQLARMS